MVLWLVWRQNKIRSEQYNASFRKDLFLVILVLKQISVQYTPNNLSILFGIWFLGPVSEKASLWMFWTPASTVWQSCGFKKRLNSGFENFSEIETGVQIHPGRHIVDSCVWLWTHMTVLRLVARFAKFFVVSHQKFHISGYGFLHTYN